MDLLDATNAMFDSLLPSDHAKRYRDEAERSERERVALTATLVEECANAIQLLASGISYPGISKDHLEQAMEHVRAALSAAERLEA
jgi:hypothetical protein